MKTQTKSLSVQNTQESATNKRGRHFRERCKLWILMWILAVCFVYQGIAQNLNTDGNVHTVNYSGTYKDFVVPSTPAIKEIRFTLRGGDGGTAKVTDVEIVPVIGIPPWKEVTRTVKAKGGNGATVKFTLGSGRFTPGTIFRFIVGGKGISGSSGGVGGVGFDYGGGGGGTAVIFQNPGNPAWFYLGVAGGGGGAYQGMFGYGSVDKKHGQGGRSGVSGGQGGGITPPAGGAGTKGGGGNLGFGGGGGGGGQKGYGVGCVGLSGFSQNGGGFPGVGTPVNFGGGAGGNSEGCASFTWRNGGYGFGGGGAGAGVGGGGGGYGGGGAGGAAGNGGGGGSFVTSGTTNIQKLAGGTDATPDNGVATYQVIVNQPPMAKCQNATINLDANGQATLSPTDINNGSSDPEDGTNVTLSLDKTSFNCTNLGENTVTLTVKDQDGASSTCTATVTVKDVTNPDAKCQNITVQLDANGNASITAAQINNGSTDKCGIKSMTVSPSSFTCDDIGDNTVTLTVTDNGGNKSTCTATVKVEDNVPPDAKCQNITVQLDATGNVSITAANVDNGSSDACGIKSMSVNPSSFTCAKVGDNTVTLTVTDNNDNVSTCTATVKVEDNVPPDAKCQNITVQLDATGNVSITAAQIDNSSTDNCGIKSLSVNPSSFTCDEVGDNTVTLTVTDESGNKSTCTATVTVEDNVPPDAKCQNITVQLDATGNVSIRAANVDNGSSDACGIKSMSVNPSSFTCTEVGDNTVTLTVTDNNDNVSTCTATVTVEDNVPPDAKCQNITVQLDATGNVSIRASNVDNGSSDACGIKSMSVNPSSFTCAEVGDNTVTLTVTDNNDNVSTCMATVTVEDNVPPDAKCQNITIQLDKSGKASIMADQLDDGSSDACGLDPVNPFLASQTEFDCSNLGPNKVELTVRDVNGNTNTCTSVVTIEDHLPPIVRTRDVTLTLDGYGRASVDENTLNRGSSDNCNIVRMWLEGQTNFDCGDAGEHKVVLKAEDESGNIGSNVATVTIQFFIPDFAAMLGIADGDTLHQVNCQVPREVELPEQDKAILKKYGVLRTSITKSNLPQNPPWSMYSVWKNEITLTDACAHTHRFTFYQALYDLMPPDYQYFPLDTTVATTADVPEVDQGVKIIDVCQYVVWDTVTTTPVIEPATGDTIAFTRRWMARDPSGHQSYRDQMIWIGSGNRTGYGMITGRIAPEDQVGNTRFPGEPGQNGIPVSLYRLDTDSGTRMLTDTRMTGDWAGEQGFYYFTPQHPGQYQVKIDSAICLVDTLKFDRKLWSDTLTLVGGHTIDQGWILTTECPDTATVDPDPETDVTVIDGLAEGEEHIHPFETTPVEWTPYPNPAQGYLSINIRSDASFSYILMDALGRMVKQGDYHQGQTIDIHALKSGVYHLQLREADAVLGTKRVLILE